MGAEIHEEEGKNAEVLAKEAAKTQERAEEFAKEAAEIEVKAAELFKADDTFSFDKEDAETGESSDTASEKNDEVKDAGGNGIFLQVKDVENKEGSSARRGKRHRKRKGSRAGRAKRQHRKKKKKARMLRCSRRKQPRLKSVL